MNNKIVIFVLSARSQCFFNGARDVNFKPRPVGRGLKFIERAIKH